jgi:divalent metal cation (Fe/Co/Zn/Cd) transporter
VSVGPEAVWQGRFVPIVRWLHTAAARAASRPISLARVEATTDPADREPLLRSALRLSLISIGFSGVVGTIAVVAALSSGALSLLGFGFDAVLDAAASIVLVWRFRIEREHPHRAARVEHIAELAIGAVFLVLAAYLALNAVQALRANTYPESTAVGIGLLILSLLCLPPLAGAKNRTAAALQSGALRADSLLTGLAAVLAVIGLGSLALTTFARLNSADAVGALIVAVIMAREGLSALRSKEVAD